MQAPFRTPDGRYIIVRSRLWRAANPNLPESVRAQLVHDLMAARRSIKEARSVDDVDSPRSARKAVNAAKAALGERGPVWWSDGASDLTRHLVKNTPYAAWYSGTALAAEE